MRLCIQKRCLKGSNRMRTEYFGEINPLVCSARLLTCSDDCGVFKPFI